MPPNVKVVDKGLAKILKQMGKVGQGGGTAALVGIQGDEAAADHGGITNAELGAIHEYGTKDKRIPERSHFRTTIAEKEKELERGLKQAALDVFSGKDPEGELLLTGEVLRVAIQRKIKEGLEPGLSEATIASGRGEGPPLLDTGQYWNSFSTRVEKIGQLKEGS